MPNGVRISTSVDDQISGPLDRMRQQFDKLGTGAANASLLGNLGARAIETGMSLAARAVGEVVNIVGDSVAAFREEEKSIAGLKAALQANIPAWDGNVDAIEKVIASREKLAFSDDSQRESLKILLAVTHDSTKALDAQSVAMDLARFKSIDLQTASDLVAKVLGGNVSILKRYGISLRDGATATEALAAIQRLAGGAARAYAETDLGKVEAANIRVDDSMEKVGRSFSKIGSTVMPILADAADSLATKFDGLAVVTEGAVDRIGGAFQKSTVEARLASLGATGAQVFGFLNPAFKDLADQAVVALDKIGGEVPVVTGAMTNWKDSLGNVIDPAGRAVIALDDTGAAAKDMAFSFEKSGLKAALAVADSMGSITRDVRHARDDIHNALQSTIDDSYKPLVTAAELAVTKLELADARAAASKKGLTAIEKAQADLRVLTLEQEQAEKMALIDTFGTDSAVAAKVAGAYTTSEWRAGLTSQDPEVRADFAHLLELQTQAALEAAAAAKPQGQAVGSGYGLSVAGGINGAAGDIDWAVMNAGSAMTSFNPSGYPIGYSWSAEIAAGITANNWRIETAVNTIDTWMSGASPPKAGPLKHIDKGARNIAKAWTDNFAAGLGGTGLTNALSRISAAMASGPGAASGGLSTAMSAVGGGGGSPVEIPIVLDGAEIARVIDRQLYYRRGARGLLPSG